MEAQGLARTKVLRAKRDDFAAFHLQNLLIFELGQLRCDGSRPSVQKNKNHRSVILIFLVEAQGLEPWTQ